MCARRPAAQAVRHLLEWRSSTPARESPSRAQGPQSKMATDARPEQEYRTVYMAAAHRAKHRAGGQRVLGGAVPAGGTSRLTSVRTVHRRPPSNVVLIKLFSSPPPPSLRAVHSIRSTGAVCIESLTPVQPLIPYVLGPGIMLV
jgi:hypothetical protein